MLSQEESEFLLWLENKLDSYRGKYANLAIKLELTIENLISFHFTETEEKQNQFQELILKSREFSFSIKTDLLRKIFKDLYPGLYKLYNTDLNTIDKIRSKRNDMAHALAEGRQEILTLHKDKKDLLFLTKIKGYKLVSIQLNTQELDAQLKEGYIIFEKLNKLYSELSSKKHGV